MEMSGSGKAMVLANQPFTRRACLLAQQAGCVLIDREALADLAAQYHQGHRVLTFHHSKEAVGKRIRKQQ
jgi:hypothetical protein